MPSLAHGRCASVGQPLPASPSSLQARHPSPAASAQAVRESTAAWPAGARVAQAIIRGRRMQPGHWPLSRPRLRARTGASAELGAGPEIDDSKTTNSCFTSPPTPKALPLPPQNPRFVCPKALTSTLPSLLDVATALASEAGPHYVLSSLNTPQTLADPFRSLYASHYIIRTWQDLWARLIRLILSLHRRRLRQPLLQITRDRTSCCSAACTPILTALCRHRSRVQSPPRPSY
jgi:hypothetical protein